MIPSHLNCYSTLIVIHLHSFDFGALLECMFVCIFGGVWGGGGVYGRPVSSYDKSTYHYFGRFPKACGPLLPVGMERKAGSARRLKEHCIQVETCVYSC